MLSLQSCQQAAATDSQSAMGENTGSLFQLRLVQTNTSSQHGLVITIAAAALAQSIH
jgi:hypothetical protein